MQHKLTTFLGALLLAVFMVAPAQAQIATFSGDTTGDPTFNRPSGAGNGTTCPISGIGTAVPYEVATTFTAPSSGSDFTISVFPGSTLDAVVLTYMGSFDPNNPCVNLIGYEDSGFADGDAEIEDDVTLVGGTSYVVVVTGFNNTDFGTYTGTVEQDAPPPMDEAGDIVNVPAADAGGLEDITGTIGANEDEDCYSITITDADNFSAEVDSFSPDGDSQLFLFDADLTGVFFDDDDGAGLLSLIDTMDVSLTNGDYFLCITAFNNDPLNSDGVPIFSFTGLPSPSTGDSTLASWNDNGFLSAPSMYNISLTGVGATTGPITLNTSGVPSMVAPGSSVTISYSVTNNSMMSLTGDLFYTVARNGVTFQRQIVRSGTIPAGVTVNGSYSQAVPSNAPSGDYTYTISVGNFPNAVESDSYVVTVSGTSRDAQFAALLAEAKQSGSMDAYNEAVKAELTHLKASAWTVTNATPWAVERNEVASAARAGDLGVFPNPFVERTEIAFSLENASKVSLVVYDVRGREVATLAEGTMEAGQHSVTFDAASLPSGVYIYRLQAGSQTETGRMTLVQ